MQEPHGIGQIWRAGTTVGDVVTQCGVDAGDVHDRVGKPGGLGFGDVDLLAVQSDAKPARLEATGRAPVESQNRFSPPPPSRTVRSPVISATPCAAVARAQLQLRDDLGVATRGLVIAASGEDP